MQTIKRYILTVFMLAAGTGLVFSGSQDYQDSVKFPALWLFPPKGEGYTPAKDLAQEKSGRPWNFDKDNDLQGFKCSEEAKASAGALRFKTKGKPATVNWGAHTGQPIEEQVTLPRMGSIAMKVKQSASTSTWNFAVLSGGQNANVQYPIKPREVKGTEWQTISFGWFGSPPMDGFTITVSGPEGNEIAIDEIKIPVGSKRQACFRKSYTIPKGEIFRAIVNVPKKERFFVNGEEVKLPLFRYPFLNGYRTVAMDIKKYLKEGENVLGLMLDGSWVAPFIYLEGAVVMKSGESIPLRTGKDWKMNLKMEDGWTSPGFNDSAWSPPAEARQKSDENWFHDPGLVVAYSGRILIKNPYEEQLFYSDEKDTIFNFVIPPGMAKEQPRLSYRILWKNEIAMKEGELTSFAEKPEGLFQDLNAGKFPRGVYELETELKVQDKTIDRHTEIFIVVGRIPQKEVEGNFYEEGMDLELYDVINCSDEKDPHPYMEGGGGASRIVTSGGLKYREAGGWRGQGKEASHFAYKVKFAPHKPYLVVIEYPDDKDRAMQISINNLPALTEKEAESLDWWNLLKTSAGVITGGKLPTSGQMKKLRLILYPIIEDQMILVATAGQDLPAAAGRILVYEIKGDLPALKVVSGGERRLGLHTERGNSFAHVFSPYNIERRTASWDPWREDWSPEAFRMRMKVIENYVAYMRFCGENMYLAGAYQYGPANSPYGEPNLINDSRLETDYRDLMCKIFEYNGIAMLAGVEYNWTWHDLYNLDLSPADGEIARGKETMWMVHRSGKQAGVTAHRSWTPGPPTTVPNMFHPAVQASILNIVGDICKRWAKYPSFEGLVFSSYPGDLGLVIGHLPRDLDFLSYGYGDYTIKLFEKETKIKIPVNDTDYDRFQQRYDWLMKNKEEEWIDWRCQKMLELHRLILKKIKEARPDLKLFSLFYNSAECIDDWLSTSGTDFHTYMRWMAQDPSLYATEKDLCAGRFLYNQPAWNCQAYNRHPEVIKAYERNDNRAVMVFCPFDENYITHKWTKQFPWMKLIVDAPEPGIAFTEPFVHSVIDSDPDRIFYGWMDGNILFGQEESRRKFNQAFLPLPKEKFRPVTGEGVDKNVAVRELARDGKHYFYVINPGWWDVKLAIELKDKANITDHATGKTVTDSLIKTALGPYGINSFCVSSDIGLKSIKADINHQQVKPCFEKKLNYLENLASLPDTEVLFSPEDLQYLRTTLKSEKEDIQAGRYAVAYEKESSWQMQKMVASLKSIGKIKPWLVIGPFKNSEDDTEFKKMSDVEKDILSDKPDETRKKKYTGLGRTADPVEVTWKYALSGGGPAGHDNFVNFDKLFSPNEWVIAYAFTRVYSPVDQEAVLSTGSDDGIRVWLNKELVIDNYIGRGAAPGQDKAAIKLNKGWNDVLVKVEERIGGWGFFMDFLDKQNAPISGLIYSPKQAAKP